MQGEKETGKWSERWLTGKQHFENSIYIMLTSGQDNKQAFIFSSQYYYYTTN